jgi:uncharacterized membrane protein
VIEFEMSAGNFRYTSASERAIERRRCLYVWTLLVVIALAWVLAIVAAPVLAAGGTSSISSPIYGFFGLICHQMPERSFFIFGNQMAVCSRCFGVYTGLAAGLTAYPLWRAIDNIEPLPRFWLFAAMLPIGIDWSLGVLGIWANTFASRYITGAILGIACATYIVPAAVEIVKLRFQRRRVPRESH